MPLARSLAAKYPALARELHPDRNCDVAAQSLASSSNWIVWWICPRGHEWQARVYARTNGGSGCQVCARAYVPAARSLGYKHPLIAKELHPSRNGGIDPLRLAAKSSRKVWWQCDKGHEWEARVGDRTRGTGCPRCSDERRRSGQIP